MSATSSYQAGIESNAVELSYGVEATWGTAPASAFTALRMTGESLSGKKNRTRPSEVRTDAQASAAVTQSESADGAINFALSYGTYDDLLASLFNNDWSSDLSITGVSGDISTVASGNKVTSTTSGKFDDVEAGQWIKLGGFSDNAGYVRVTTKTDGETLVVAGKTLTDETPTGTTATITGSGYLRNSNSFKSLFIQKKFASDKYLTYAGSQVTGMTLNIQQGNFVSGSFTIMSKVEAKATSDSSTGSVSAAPTGDVINSVGDFVSIMKDGTALTGTVNAVTLSITKDGAAADYGVGDASAQGMRMGLLTLTGTLEVYFNDFTLYDLFTAETASAISFQIEDAAGASYIFTIPSATIMNPGVNSDSPNKPVIAKFQIEGNPHSSFDTIEIDRFDAS